MKKELKRDLMTLFFYSVGVMVILEVLFTLRGF